MKHCVADEWRYTEWNASLGEWERKKTSKEKKNIISEMFNLRKEHEKSNNRCDARRRVNQMQIYNRAKTSVTAAIEAKADEKWWENSILKVIALILYVSIMCSDVVLKHRNCTHLKYACKNACECENPLENCKTFWRTRIFHSFGRRSVPLGETRGRKKDVW